MQQTTSVSSARHYAELGGRSVPKTSLLDTFAVFSDVVLPTLAKGVIIRRPWILSLAERLDLDRRAIRRMQRLRKKYGTGPLLLRIPGRSIVLILDPRHVHRVLEQSADPFATATKEKIAALAHFEPRNALISTGAERAERRRFNDQVLESHTPVHRLAASFVETVNIEVDRLFESVFDKRELTWSDFSNAWFRIVRRVVFGESAVEDHDLSAIMAKLRSTANWAFLAPQRPQLRQRLLNRIQRYIEQAEPNSLAAVIAQTPTTGATAPAEQVPQWLFAFDPAGMTTFRSLALLAMHPSYARVIREEIGSPTAAGRQNGPQLRALVLESLRLWPTSPLIIRETTTETNWSTGLLPADAAVVIYTPFFHRDDERLPYADKFAPELWTDSQPDNNWPLVPFSEGPAVCPGRNLVLLLSSAAIRAILEHTRIRLIDQQRFNADRLPATLNHFGLRFELLRHREQESLR